MDIPSHITTRRSIFPRFFTGGGVSNDVLVALMAAANQAPSHRKTEPWRYRIYRGKGKMVLLQEIQVVYEARYGAGAWDSKLDKKFRAKLQKSGAVLSIFLYRDPKDSVPEWEEVAAVACSVQNIWTSLDAYDLGGYWSSPRFLCGDYGEYPGAKANERCLGLFYLGPHQAPDLPRPRGATADKFSIID